MRALALVIFVLAACGPSPTDTGTECNRSQRHRGVWDDGAFRMKVGQYNISLTIPKTGAPRIGGVIDITTLQARSVADQLSSSLGLVMAVGKLARQGGGIEKAAGV